MANLISDIINQISMAKKVQGLRPYATEDDSTVLMESGGPEGKSAYPTLYLDENNQWQEIFGEEAYLRAKETDELFNFPTEDATQRFAEGGWKQENLEKSILNALLKHNLK